MRPAYKQSREPVVQWLRNLPLASRLSEACPSESLSDLAALTQEQVREVCRLFFTDFEAFFLGELLQLKNALSMVQDRASNSKFMYQGNFGSKKDFHTPLYNEIGAPNTNWLLGMKLEHIMNSDRFTTGNYNIETCPEDEWALAADGKLPRIEHLGGGRNIRNIDELMGLEESVKAGLTRAEVIALVLYTGPMYQIYNTILRKYPSKNYESMKAKDSLFSTTICVLVSAIQKLARVMVLEPGTLLYRGIAGNMELPTRFTTPDEHGCLGVMEYGFMSTTADWSTAVSYANGCLMKILAIDVGAVDRGADISKYSQYPGEKEFLWVPHSFLEPVGGSELRITEKGVVQVIKVKVNANTMTVTIDEYEQRQKELHMASFKVQMQDLRIRLDEMSSTTKDELTLKRFVAKCVEEFEEVRRRHERRDAAEYNKDAVNRNLVTEMLDSKKYSLGKMEYLLACSSINEEDYLAKPMRICFRDFMCSVMQSLKASPSRVRALDMCKVHDLLLQDVFETNELGETPLIAACAEGVTDDQIELLLEAGSEVNAIMDYSGNLRKLMTPLLTASLYGRPSTVSMLAAHGGDIRAINGEGVSCVWFAALGGHTTVVELLAGLGADVNTPHIDGRTPIFIAAQKGHRSVVEVLARLGADINAASKDGRTPMFIAALKGHTSVVEALAGVGADVNIPDNDECTPMFIAAQKGHVATVEALLQLGAGTSAARQGMTAMDIAIENKHAGVVQVFKAAGAQYSRWM